MIVQTLLEPLKEHFFVFSLKKNAAKRNKLNNSGALDICQTGNGRESPLTAVQVRVMGKIIKNILASTRSSTKITKIKVLYTTFRYYCDWITASISVLTDGSVLWMCSQNCIKGG